MAEEKIRLRNPENRTEPSSRRSSDTLFRNLNMPPFRRQNRQVIHIFVDITIFMTKIDFIVVFSLE